LPQSCGLIRIGGEHIGLVDDADELGEGSAAPLFAAALAKAGALEESFYCGVFADEVGFVDSTAVISTSRAISGNFGLCFATLDARDRRYGDFRGRWRGSPA
jgi:hypothetical protein